MPTIQLQPNTSAAAASATKLDFRCFVAEALGTAILVLIGCGAAIVSSATQAFGHSGIALAFGLVVTLLVASLGPISGAHINPAVTVAFWSTRRFPTRYVLPYILAQCVGAISASFVLRWLLGTSHGFAATVPSLTTGRAFAVEAGFSGVLALVIVAVATDERIPKMIVPFVIGSTVLVGALVTGPLTGGSFNPARSLGPAVTGNVWEFHWLYWLAPIGGMMLGARTFEWLRGTEPPNASSRGVPTGLEGPI
ncbi:MAG: aquaporin [Phycisphaerae bacterium]|nr:aquaporin [Gemmatimonadaceae bacterium]